jgi:hypothetical protein
VSKQEAKIDYSELVLRVKGLTKDMENVILKNQFDTASGYSVEIAKAAEQLARILKDTK